MGATEAPRFLRTHENGQKRPDAVIGLGNEIARDDGIGIVAARRLSQLLARRHDVEVIALPWAGFALLDALTGRRRAAIIDCLASDRHPPGAIVRLVEDDFRGSVRLNSFHDIDFATVIGLGRRLGWSLPGEIAIWAVEGAVMDEFGVGLTPPVAAAVDPVIHEVLDFLDRVPLRSVPLGSVSSQKERKDGNVRSAFSGTFRARTAPSNGTGAAAGLSR